MTGGAVDLMNRLARERIPDMAAPNPWIPVERRSPRLRSTIPSTPLYTVKGWQAKACPTKAGKLKHAPPRLVVGQALAGAPAGLRVEQRLPPNLPIAQTTGCRWRCAKA